MSLEDKSAGLTGASRIGRVRFSKTGRTIYYAGKSFDAIGGRGVYGNHIESETRTEFWISGCKRDGTDRLYPGIVEIDDDVREEYWSTIRNKPECVGQASFRSEGKYSKRRPR